MATLHTLLGITAEADHEAVSAAFNKKKAELEAGIANAPTPALRQKFTNALAELEAAHSQHQSAPEKSGVAAKRSASPLSQTKLADLPGVAAGDVHAIELQVGQVLAGRYEIQALIGQGGMGAVYQAHDRNTERDIALKVLLPSLFKNERAKARFMSEAKISQQLSHPHIVNVFDVQQDGELFFLTMELLEGQDLRGWLANLKAVGQQPDIAEVKRIVGELCDALAYAHEYTIHRDIKPENIWLDGKGRVKLMDFGIAQVQSASQRTQTGAAMGTAYYMAPEQLQGRELNGTADLYAVGVLLYEMLTGQIPAGRFEPAMKLRPAIGKALSAVVDQCMAVAPEQRFDSATALKQALLSGKGVQRRNPQVGRQFAMAASLLVGVVVFGALAYSGTLNGLWEALKPLDRDQLAQQQADATRLLGEIRNLESRLDNSVQNLERDVSEAVRNDAPNRAHLEEWEQLAVQHISESSELTRLEGELALGETLLRDETQAAQALASLSLVREGYQVLLDKFNTIDRLLAEEPNTETAKEAWLTYRQGYEFSDPSAIADADSLNTQAQGQKREGLFAEALVTHQSIQQAYTEARGQVAAQMATIDAERESQRQAANAAAVAERERLAAVERDRLAAVAAAEAEREPLAQEEAERQRVASIEGERLRVEALEQKKQALLQEFARFSLVEIPAGSFQMGSSETDREKPEHKVDLPGFLMMAHEVTFTLWDECTAVGACVQADDFGWGRGDRPVINVSWDDIQNYIGWLNGQTGGRFRLPTEAEWEYAARAGSTTRYSWGDDISCSQAAYDRAACGNDRTVEVKSYGANAFGLYDMHGNVWEWVQDCWNENHIGAPVNGNARLSGDCSNHVIRGGSWDHFPVDLRSSHRLGNSASAGFGFGGFRLVQNLPV